MTCKIRTYNIDELTDYKNTDNYVTYEGLCWDTNRDNIESWLKSEGYFPSGNNEFEFKKNESGNLCTYCAHDSGRFRANKTNCSCASGIDGIGGKTVKFKRKTYNADPVECCLANNIDNVDCDNVNLGTVKLLNNNTCAPDNRSLFCHNCPNLVINSCSSSDFFTENRENCSKLITKVDESGNRVNTDNTFDLAVNQYCSSENGKLDDNCNCYNAIINFKKNNTGWAVCQLPECMQSSEEITPLLTNEQHEHYKTCKSCNTGLISDNVYNSNIDIEVNCDLYGLPPSNNNNIKKNPLVIILLLLFISLILIIVYVKLIK